MKQRALIIVDLQNDFMPGGSLEVPQGHEVIPIANAVQKHFDLIIATKDWHPEEHGSFAKNHPGHREGEVVNLAGLRQILWPRHCVQNSSGSEFVKDFDTSRITKVIHKGTDTQIDSYSTFFDNAHRRSTGLDQFLQEHNVEEVYILGVATDYCVKYSVLDARHLGYKTFVIEDACRGVNLKPDDSMKALEEMKSVGAEIIQSHEIPGV